MSPARIVALAAVLAMAAPAVARAAAPESRYLVSLGDSYASGFRSTGLAPPPSGSSGRTAAGST